MSKLLTVLFIAVCSASVASAQWITDGPFDKYNAPAGIASPYVSSIPAGGNAVFMGATEVIDIHMITGVKMPHALPAGTGWIHLPRSPYLALKTTAEGANTIVAIHHLWTNQALASFSLAVNTTGMSLQLSDTWVADDGKKGCLVYGPADGAPTDGADYQITFFKDGALTGQQRIKNKSDLDIYVMPHPDLEMLAFIRGNGLTLYPNEAEEVFTYGSYLSYRPDGSFERLSLPVRGPGSGKGRRIVWSSAKWDRLLLSDEAAAGGLLIKASNGIVVDSITSSAVDAGKPLTFLSASGSSDSRWMVSHTRVGDKNAMILWAMPETVETTWELFSPSDDARKILPTSDWRLVMPFVKEKNGEYSLFSWDPEDIVAVNEVTTESGITLYPQPTNTVLNVKGLSQDGEAEVEFVSAVGERVSSQKVNVLNGELRFDIAEFPVGVYSLHGRLGGYNFSAQFIRCH